MREEYPTAEYWRASAICARECAKSVAAKIAAGKHSSETVEEFIGYAQMYDREATEIEYEREEANKRSMWFWE